MVTLQAKVFSLQADKKIREWRRITIVSALKSVPLAE
jgi:hypothetical protein